MNIILKYNKNNQINIFICTLICEYFAAMTWNILATQIYIYLSSPSVEKAVSVTLQQISIIFLYNIRRQLICDWSK